jgi:GNAT superfamily N-acetyltransferase
VKVTYKFINDVFRGKVYGNYDIFTAASFRDFVFRHDVDPSHGINAYDDGTVVGTLLFAQRGKRAWLSLMGVLPKYRRTGLGRTIFIEALDAVESLGVTSMEFESILRNEPVRAMYAPFGFSEVDRLCVWARKAKRTALPGLRFKKRTLAEVEAIARKPSTCWQREPIAVARATNSALMQIDGAYAFVRMRGENAVILDAGARDEDAADALIHELDQRVAADISFLNEPADSPISTVLADSRGWRLIDRQYRMMRTR